ncbi:phage tail protein [Nocardia panacis]|uniref:Phage tail protein n=1 Tax=Nocardia panacis TaxID=2340916 RepID=A0A3A4KBS5_9NOCA|nr:phage tail protein [Nocardia panacis]RJO79307.1 phage tail protein [Nocardia panacis]
MADLVVELESWRGDWFTLYGPNQGDRGVVLGEKPEGLLDDEPFETRWYSHAFQLGATPDGVTVNRKDLHLGVEILPTEHGSWGESYSGWRRAWSTTRDSRLWVSTANSRRYLAGRLTKTPGFNPETDPFVRRHGRVETFVTAGDPRWKEPDATAKWVSTIDTTDGSWAYGKVTIANPCDYPMWLVWVVQAYAGAKYRLPDYSWGSDRHERADADKNRVIQLPTLIAGEHLRVDTDPDTAQVVSDIDTQIYQRMNGVRFMYPVPPETRPTRIEVGVSGAPAGVGVQVRCRRNWSSPLLIG